MDTTTHLAHSQSDFWSNTVVIGDLGSIGSRKYVSVRVYKYTRIYIHSCVHRIASRNLSRYGKLHKFFVLRKKISQNKLKQTISNYGD